MSTEERDISVKFEFLTCANCGIMFAMTRQFVERRREDCKEFSCPRGHKNTFYDEEDDKKDQEKINQNLRNHLSMSGLKNRALIRSNAALRGQITKLNKKLRKE